MNEKDTALLRKAYSDIILGYTKVYYEGKPLSIKHFTTQDQGLIDTEYSVFIEAAEAKGLPSLQDRIKTLIKQGLWSVADESWIVRQKNIISDLYNTKSKYYLKSDIDRTAGQIQDCERDLKEKLSERDAAAGLVAETYATKKLNEKYIFYAFCNHKDINETFFSEQEFAELSSGELNNLVSLYNQTLKSFSSSNLKKIGLSPFFQSVYCLCEDNPYTFFGYPVCKLTYYQSEIFLYGRFFKSILGQEVKPPEDILDDPDEIISWHQSNKNSQSVIKEDSDVPEGTTTAIFGASKRDLKNAGVTPRNSLAHKAIKEGKSITIDEAVKMQK